MQEIHVQSLIWEDALEKGMALLSKNPLKYSYLGNPMDREALQATAHELQRSQMTWGYTGLHLMEAAAATTMGTWRRLRMPNTVYWPQMAEMHSKGMFSESIIPYTEKC